MLRTRFVVLRVATGAVAPEALHRATLEKIDRSPVACLLTVQLQRAAAVRQRVRQERLAMSATRKFARSRTPGRKASNSPARRAATANDFIKILDGAELEADLGRR